MNEELAGQKTTLESQVGGLDRGASPVVPDHQLLRCIGRGAYGEVWLARNVMGTYRAVKIVYRKTFSSDRPYEREFTGIQKFEPISRSHEGLVDVLQIGRNDQSGYFYYVMELADDANAERGLRNAELTAAEQGREGEKEKGSSRNGPEAQSPIANRKSEIENPEAYVPKTLSKALHDRGRLPADECLQLSLSLTAALGHLHKYGLIHRDIKPSNIIFVNGIPKLADIGLVADVGEARSFVGTEGFIPLEGPGTAQADLYSLGKVVYEICTGKDRQDFPELPTLMGDGQNRTELLELNEVVLKACEDEPTRRYQSADEMHGDLLFLQGGKSVKRLRSLERRLRFVTKIGTAVVLVLSLGFGIHYLVQRQRNEQIASELRLSQRLADTMSQFALKDVEQLFVKDNSQDALARLALILRGIPADRVAAERLVSALSQRGFVLPCTEPLRHGDGGSSVRYDGDGQRVRNPSQCEVNSAQFSPDGKWVVTASGDKTARIWDARTGKMMTEPLKQDGGVTSAQFSPDGKRIVTASQDKTARIWDAKTGKLIIESLRHAGEIRSARFSADGQKLVTASEDRSARVWDAMTGKPLSKPLSHEEAVNSAEFSPDGRWVLTASGKSIMETNKLGSVRVWDAETGQLFIELLDHQAPVITAHYSLDGRMIVTASWDGSARVWNARTGQPLTQPLNHKAPVWSAQFSPDGQLVVTASGQLVVDGGDYARVWDVRTGEPLTAPLYHNFVVLSARFSPDGQRVVTASADGTARIWESKTGQPLTPPLKHDAEVVSAQFSPDGRFVVTAAKDDTARIWDLNLNQALPARLNHGGAVRFAKFSPDSQWIVTASEDKTARIWGAKTGLPSTDPLRHDHAVRWAQFSPDGRSVLTASTDGWARIWDVKTGKLSTNPLRHKSGLLFAQFSEDGQLVVTACEDKTARIWDARTGQTLTETLKHEHVVLFAQFSADGQRVVTASADNTARIWDAKTGLPLTEPLKHEGPVITAQFSADGRLVVTASLDNTARIWNSKTGQLFASPLRHEAQVVSAQFSADGQRVLTASWDKTARIWDTRTGLPLTEPLEHAGGVNSAQFSPDGNSVVTASGPIQRTGKEHVRRKGDKANDLGCVRIWDARTGLPLTEPLMSGIAFWSAEFSQDGQRIVAAAFDNTARVWEVPTIPLPVPIWLPKLVEAIAQKRFNEQGISEPVSLAELLAFKRQLAESSTTDVWTQWAKWFFADRATRIISPFSNISVPEYVRRRIEDDTLDSLQEAVRLAPTNGLAFARLARRVLEQDPRANPRRLGEADFYSRRAVEFAPDNAEVAEIRKQVTERVAATGKN